MKRSARPSAVNANANATDAIADRKFDGKLSAINPAVDTLTRNVTLQAVLDNKDHALRPGMFAKVQVILPEEQKTLIVPGSAVSYAPYGDSVFVIEKKKDEKTGQETQVLRQQFVRIGEARGDFVSVTKGLKAGDIVVGTGVFKLRNGMAVTPGRRENAFSASSMTGWNCVALRIDHGIGPSRTTFSAASLIR